MKDHDLAVFQIRRGRGDSDGFRSDGDVLWKISDWSNGRSSRCDAMVGARIIPMASHCLMLLVNKMI